MDSRQHTVTRRGFVAGAGATCAAALASSSSATARAEEAGAQAAVSGEDWLGAEPEEPSEYALELECDVVVCGLGHAGVAATRAAAEAGASVVVFEKGTGFGLPSSDFAAFGSTAWLEHFPSDAKYFEMKTRIVNEVSKCCLYRNNAELVSRWADLNGEAFDWYVSAPDDVAWANEEEGNAAIPDDAAYAIEACGWPYPKNYDPLAENMPCFPGSGSMETGDGAVEGGFLGANLERAMEAGGDKVVVYRETPAVRLLREDGRVTGVVAKGADGYVKASAAKGVVLACGGFMNDEAMLRRFCPRLFDEGFQMGDSLYGVYGVADADGNPTNTGDGHRMGVWAGAQLQMDGCNMSHLVASAGARGVFGTLPFLWLDVTGRRFMNEDVQGQQFAEKIRELKGQTAIQFFDGDWASQMDDMPYGHGKSATTTTQEVIDERVEDGSLVRADTIEDLLAQLDIDQEQALASIERYNELCAQGVDDDFGKTPTRLFPLQTPPFYANTCSKGDDLVTMSGILTDTECRALDADREPIPGLFVAGNTQGGRFALIYPETFMGLSVAMAVTFGRLAGTNAATLA